MLLSRDTDGITGAELWRSDGTEAGTVMVKDINPGAGNTSFAALTNVNGIAFVRASQVDTNNAELWNSDGNEAGTLMVRDINLSGGSDPQCLQNGNGTLFFRADDGTNCSELWALQLGPPPIPTVSEWGLVAMALLVISAETIVFGRPGARGRGPKESGLPEGGLG